MARLQYQPATKSKGFQPSQLSRAGITRMEQEGDRVIRNLEKQRDAANQQRRADLQAMQANSVYEQQARERNRRTLEANIKNDQIARENERKFKIAEADRKSKSIDSTVKELVDFSKILGEQAAEKTKQMISDQIAEGSAFSRQEYLDSPELQNDFATVESQLDVETEIFDQKTIQNGAKGLDSSLQTAKNLASNPGRGYYWKKGYYNEFIKQQTPLLVNRALQDTEESFVDENGNSFSGFQAADNADYMRIVLGQVQNSLYGATGLDINSLEPGFLADSSKYVTEYSKTKINQAATNETNKTYDIIAGQSEDLRTQGKVQAAFLLDLKNPKLGREGALTNFFSLYSAQNADGTFRYEPDELNKTILRDGMTAGESHRDSLRMQRAMAARNKARTDFLQDENTRVRIEAKEFDNQAYNKLANLLQTETDPSKDLEILATYKSRRAALFNNEALSDKIVRLEKSVLAGNLSDETIKLEQQIRLKILSPEYIDSIQNPKLQGQASIAYKELQAEKFGPNYADTKKDIKNRAEKLAGLNPNVEGRGSRQSFMAITAGENEFQFAYKKYKEGGMPDKVAEEKAREYVEKVMSDTENKDSLFYKTTGPLNTPVFPKLEAKYNTLADLALETRQELRKGLIKKGISVLNTPGSVGTEEELVSSTNDYYNNNGQFKYNSNELLVSKLFKVPPYAVRNAAITAFNKADGGNRRLIEPTALEEEVFDQEPRTLKLITDTERITNNRFRRTVHSTNGIGNGPVRASMTGTGLRGLASLVSSGEGSATSMFPSENYPEMLDMTIGEVVGFQKEKLRDGRKSAAVGSYQFLYPETAAQRAGLSLDDKFTPENQLKMFVGTLLNKPGRENVSALLQGTGDDIETAIDELSQEFASIEYRNGRSYYEDGVNKASISRDQVRAALISAREELTN